MPEFISHVPNPEEARQWAADREAAQAMLTPDNFNFGGYQELAREFSEKIGSVQTNESLDEDTRGEAIEVLTKGTLSGAEIGSSYVNRNIVSEWNEREYLANMLMSGDQSKEAAKAIIEKGVCGFHSTRSQALAGMLESGALMSAYALNEKGHIMVTGEHYYQKPEGQDTISFSNLAESRNAALDHAGEHGVKVRAHETVLEDMRAAMNQMSELDDGSRSDNIKQAVGRYQAAIQSLEANPDSLFAALNKHEFPVMVGISKDYIEESEDRREKSHLLRGVSHLGEFRPVDTEIPLAALPVVAVPAEVVAPVTELFRMFGHPDTKIVAFETLVA